MSHLSAWRTATRWCSPDATRLVVLLQLEVRLNERLAVLVVQDDRHVGRLLRRRPLDRLGQLLLGLQALGALAQIMAQSSRMSGPHMTAFGWNSATPFL